MDEGIGLRGHAPEGDCMFQVVASRPFSSDQNLIRVILYIAMTVIDETAVGEWKRWKLIRKSVAVMLAVTFIGVLIIFLSRGKITVCNFRGLN